MGAALDRRLSGLCFLGLLGNLRGEFAHQAFQHLEFGHDLAALRAALRLNRGFHFLDFCVSFAESYTEFLRGLFQLGNLAARFALLAPAPDGALNLRQEQEGNGAGRGRLGRICNTEHSEHQDGSSRDHGVDEDQYGVGHDERLFASLVPSAPGGRFEFVNHAKGYSSR